MGKDLYYTPPELAKHLVSFVKKKSIQSVADFCVGGGELLNAARNKWPLADFYGCDISRNAIESIKKEHPYWNFSKCDFLNKNSRNSSRILKRKFDLVLLNPPFTCKGAAIENVLFEGIMFQMSTSMAFFVEAINYLNNDGVMYAILPQSVAYSEKDKKIRLYLKERYNFRILEERNGQGFEKCAPNIVLASINDLNAFPINGSFKNNLNVNVLELQRGKISMHAIPEAKDSILYLVHSTNIRNNKILNLKYKVDPVKSQLKGPALLIHRVGQPDINKLCVISEKDVYALSDCVIGIKTETNDDAYLLKKEIEENWECFSELYKGTGARYITLNRLEDFLNIDK